MIYNPEIHHRRSIRLQGFDYSQPGVYFVTVVAYHRACLFGDVVNSDMRLNVFGEIAADCWREIPKHFDNVEPDAFVAMPNHVHGTIQITVGATHASPLQTSSANYPGAMHTSPRQMIAIMSVPPHGPQSQSIAAIVGSYKSAVTRQINRLRSTPGSIVWQRNYYEHIVRNEDEWSHIRDYIVNNPVRWSEDSENPDNRKGDPPTSVALTAPPRQITIFRDE